MSELFVGSDSISSFNEVNKILTNGSVSMFGDKIEDPDAIAVFEDHVFVGSNNNKIFTTDR